METDVETIVHRVNPAAPEPGCINAAAAVIRGGGLVAFPTETVYGLGADATSAEAVRGIFRAKGRPSDNPLIVHIASWKDFAALAAQVPAGAQALAERFWPGPLTMVVRRKPGLPDEVTAGLETVGIRMPNHPVALALLRAAKVPVAAPSANRSGRPSPTRAEDVLADLDGRIDLVLDAGPTGVGVESTVLDLTSPVPTILRPGGVTLEDLAEVLPRVEVDPGLLHQGETPKAPGMKYRHYAPKAEVLLVAGDDLDSLAEGVSGLAREKMSAGTKVGIMATAETEGRYQDLAREGAPVLVVGNRSDLATVAAGLFTSLRELDRLECGCIIAEAVPEKGIGLAIMNRLRKSAGGRIIHV